MKAKNKFQVARKYDLEKTFNQLFVQSKTEKIFDNLYKLIVGEDNILLAMKNTRLGILDSRRDSFAPVEQRCSK